MYGSSRRTRSWAAFFPTTRGGHGAEVVRIDPGASYAVIWELDPLESKGERPGTQAFRDGSVELATALSLTCVGTVLVSRLATTDFIIVVRSETSGGQSPPVSLFSLSAILSSSGGWKDWASPVHGR